MEEWFSQFTGQAWKQRSRRSIHTESAGDCPTVRSQRPPLPGLGSPAGPGLGVGTQVAARGRGSLCHRPRPGASFALPWAVQGEGRHREEGTGLRLPVSGWQKAEFLCPCLCSRGVGGRKPQRAPGLLPAAAWGLEQRPGCPEDTTGRSPGSRPGGPATSLPPTPHLHTECLCPPPAHMLQS